jgi:hypothetical protein
MTSRHSTIEIKCQTVARFGYRHTFRRIVRMRSSGHGKDEAGTPPGYVIRGRTITGTEYVIDGGTVPTA